ncbi:hypothetical protein PQO03_02025 [Lentisphaera profundi]|uniref:Uncharacterized protein n=1 Tax=Lentisphaera profundi TaxID=1658616 RepID=A0ABY7VRA8_9BACT|nr:hypothetical protein [Lentisphaera profundi]WDE96740.1 hypothetical protein PQO03_02025 [Lentisphaera profundi]
MSGKLDKFDEEMADGKYVDAKDFALKEKKDLLWTLQAAAATSAAGEFEESNALFDKAEEMFIAARRTSGAADKVGTLSSLLVNDNVIAYKGEVYDGILINTYKALNFMFLKQWDLARVELNRAYDRQRRATDFYAKEILEQEEKASKSGFSVNVSEMMSSPDIKKLSGLEAYADYVNPMVNLMEVLYLKYQGDAGDSERLRQTQNRLLAMTQSKHLQKDLSLSQDWTWVIIENGQMPRRVEWRIDFPIGVFSGLIKELDNLSIVSVAIPKLKDIPATYNQFVVNGENVDMISDMDKIIHAEYSRALPTIITKALVSTAIKTIAQYRIGQAKGHTTAFFVGLLQAVSTQADIRSWSALPKNYHLAIVPSGSIALTSRGGHLGKVETKGNSMLYFKVSRSGVVSSQVLVLD